MAEFVPGYEASNWFGVCAPNATPAEIVEKLNNEINAGHADARMRARLAELGGDVLALARLPPLANSSPRSPRSGARW